MIERAAHAIPPLQGGSSELSDWSGKELAAHYRSGESPAFSKEFFNATGNSGVQEALRRSVKLQEKFPSDREVNHNASCAKGCVNFRGYLQAATSGEAPGVFFSF
jgi:hypothetical protein